MGKISAMTAGTAAVTDNVPTLTAGSLNRRLTLQNIWDLLVTLASVFTTSLKVGSSGTALTQVRIYAPSLTPALIAANTTAEQTFTVAGLATTDIVFVNFPSNVAGCGIVGWRVSLADTLAITWCNNTASNKTPSAGTYKVAAIRS